MNRTLLLMLFCGLCACASGQQENSDRKKAFISWLYGLPPNKHLPQREFRTRPAPPPFGDTGFELQQPDGRVQLLPGNQQPALTNQFCRDTSYSKLIGLHNARIYNRHVTQTKDGGILLALEVYDTLRLPNPWWRSFGILVKLDADGNILWKKQFEDLTPGDFSIYLFSRSFELPNGDIILTGIHNNDGSSSTYNAIIYRLTSTGNLIWQNSIRSTIGIFNSPPGTFTFSAESATDGLNGDVILCGTTSSNLSSGKIETVIRLNNQGQVVWDANFGNHGIDGSYRFGAYGVSAFMKDGNIMLVGLSRGSNNPSTFPAINFLTLDYNNGNLLSKRFFRPDLAANTVDIFKGFSAWDNKFIRLTNGHYIFHGQLTSDWARFTDVIDHFGIVEFDASLNLIGAYTVSSRMKTNGYNSLLAIDSTGKAAVTVLEWLDWYAGNVFFATFKDFQFQNQRKAEYRDIGLPEYNGVAFLPTGGYAHIQTYSDNILNKSYVEFRKMHDSDTSSYCLGKDTMLFTLLPLKFKEDPDYYFLDPNEPNKMNSFSQNITYTDTISGSYRNGCKQMSFCDSVKIQGDTAICGAASPVTFTAFKNADCGAIVQWHIDAGIVDSIKVITETSVQVWFKNINWHGNIFATLPRGVCYPEARDSMRIGITRSQEPVSLGADTLLCHQNIKLRAGIGYSSYVWQDGSTDSIFIASATGTYWVQVKDFCGNSFTDTVKVNPFTETVNIGPDRNKCNNDTLQLRASAGFVNYTWGPVYNIVAASGSNAIVNPAADTVYYVRAEKYSGCYAYDTMKVSVHVSPPIALGRDTSLCAGDTVVLDAGPGFQQYAWSNGQLTQRITVADINNYSVIATTAQGCRSYDTLRVLNKWANPVVTLNDNPELCTGTTRTLQPGNFATYLWHDGSTAPSYIATDTGHYHVKVWDSHNCTGTDTVRITKLLPVPAGFLAADTAICTYGTVLLKPASQYERYHWSTGTSSSSITISKPGLYWLDVTDPKGCIGRDSINVRPKECLKGFYMPNAFSPDGNRRNDQLKPIIGGIVRQYQLYIYNRWGQVVFASTDPQKGWDGTFKGVAQDSNTYVWVCKYRLEGEEAKIVRGSVLIVR